MRLLDALPTVVAVAVGLAVVVLLAAAVFSRTNRHFLARRSTLEGETVEPAADRMLHAFAEMSGDKSDALDVGTALAETQLLEFAQIDRYNVIMNLIQRRLVKAHQRGGQIAQYFDHAVYEYPAQVYWTDAGWKKAELILNPPPTPKRSKVNVKNGNYVGGDVQGDFSAPINKDSTVDSYNRTQGVAPEQYAELLVKLIDSLRSDAEQLGKPSKRDAILDVAKEIESGVSDEDGNTEQTSALTRKSTRQTLLDAAKTAGDWVKAIGPGMKATADVLSEIKDLVN